MKCFYENGVYEKSLGIRILFDTWNAVTHSTHDPVIQRLAEEKFEEAKQRIMGAFYALKKQDSHFTLKELIASAFSDGESIIPA